MMTRFPKKLVIISVVIALLILSWRLIMPGAAFLVRFMDGNRANDSFVDVAVTDTIIEMADRSLWCHIYRPIESYDKVLLVVHGVHHGGYDEARMVRFAKELARLGHLVATPEIADLKRYEISKRAADDIHIAAKWLIEKSNYLEGDDTITMLGFSFAGGLSIGAAARPDIRNRVGAVFSFGGHADLDRVKRYLTTGALPDGGSLAPHVYGQAVIARQLANQLVPAAQVERFRAVLLDYLKNDFEKVKSERDTLGVESRRLVDLCLKRNVDALGRLLEAVVKIRPSHASLSPIRGEVPEAAVFLLHGDVDNVIPPSETTALAEWAAGSTETRALITGLINHVELEEADDTSIWEYWEIVRFWTELLRR